MLELRAEEVKDGGGSGVAAVLYASFHGWQKMESPPMGASFCSEKPGEGYFRGWKIKRERVKKSEWGGGCGRGVLPSHGTDQTTAGWFHSSLASHPSHPLLYPKPPPSISQFSPTNNTPACWTFMNLTFVPTRIFRVVANSLVIQQKKIGRGLKTFAKHF